MEKRFFHTNYELEVEGRKCTIENVTTRKANPPWRQEDEISISVSLDEAVESTIGFAITLPVKTYERQQLIDLIIGKIGQSFAEFRREAAEKKAWYKEEIAQQAYLDEHAEAVANILITT